MGFTFFFGQTLQKEKGQPSQAITKEIWLKKEKKNILRENDSQGKQ